jgi:quercetin dioxygenase-like cupin family protein
MSDMKAYTRVVRTHDGGSAFEDGELDLTERRIAEGVPPMLTGGMGASGAVTFLRSAAFDSEPHPAPRDQWVVMVRGAIEVQVSDGARRRFGPGDLVFVSDTTGRGHVTVGVGEPPFEALFVPAI